MLSQHKLFLAALRCKFCNRLFCTLSVVSLVAYSIMTRRHEDSDEDTYVSVGSAFELLETPEDIQRAKDRKDKELYVTDSKGRRRFHGAFTGGFSAGYFNTVGSEEGGH